MIEITKNGLSATLSFGKVDTAENGITYLREVLQEALDDYQIEITKKAALGVLLETGDPYPPIRLSVSEVAFMVRKAEIVGDDLMMTIDVLTTPQGETLSRFLSMLAELEPGDRDLFALKGSFHAIGKLVDGVAQPGTRILYPTIDCRAVPCFPSSS